MICSEPILVGATIQANSCYCGIPLKKIQLPDNCLMLGLVRQGNLMLASAEEPTVYCGDRLLALALHPAIAPTLKVSLKKTHPVSWSPLRSRLTDENHSFQSVKSCLNSLIPEGDQIQSCNN